MSRTAVVTGGTGGLGREVVRAFLGHGWRVLVPYVEQAALQRLQSELEHSGLMGVPADLTSAAGETALAEAAAEASGRVGALLNLAGGFSGGKPFWQTEAGEWERMLAINLLTAAAASRAVVPLMLEAGSGVIVNVASRAVETAPAGLSAYSVSKAAVLAFTRAMAADLKGTGLRAHCILPDIIDTPANRAAMPGADFRGWVKPAAIADLLLALTSPGCACASGSCIPVVGGP